MLHFVLSNACFMDAVKFQNYGGLRSCENEQKAKKRDKVMMSCLGLKLFCLSNL